MDAPVRCARSHWRARPEVGRGGLVGAYFTTGALSTQLFGVTATDPVTFLVVPAVLAAVALAASYLPSRSAAHIDPQQALKSD